MSYNTVPTVANGDSWSAAQHNTYIKDNFAALILWASAAGKLPYATGVNTIAGLTKPSQLAKLMMDATGVPSWVSFGNIHALGYDTSTTEFTTTSTSGADITGLSTTLITGLSTTLITSEICTILLFITGSTANTAGGSGQYTTVVGSIGGTNQTNNAVIPASYYPSYEPYSNFYLRTGVAAGSIVCKPRLITSSASGTAYFKGGSILAVAFQE